MNKLEVYIYPKSRSLRVLWTLEEGGISYQAIKVDLINNRGACKNPHPRGKVPYLVDQTVTLSETLAICLYICEKYAPFPLYPDDLHLKSQVNAWLSYAVTDLESPIWNLVKQKILLHEEMQNRILIDQFIHQAYTAIEAIGTINNEWIAGSDFSLADIFIAHNLYWARACGISLNTDAENYINRAMTRKACLKALVKNNR
ncbi:glutathione S-transferase family protein [Klebsiella quasipneumoniae]